MDFDIDSPEDFQDKSLRSLDELVRCPICCEIMTTATTIVKCQHNFCSICVRRHVESKKQCPICKVECFDNGLVTNRLVNQMTVHYKISRNNLLVLDKQLCAPETTTTPAVINPNNALLKPDNVSHKNDNIPVKTNNTHQTTNKSFSGPSASTRTTGTLLNTSKSESPQNQTSLSGMFRIKKRGFGGEVKTVGQASSYENVSHSSRTVVEEDNSTIIKIPKPLAGTSASSELQSCPVCGCSVPGHKINNHLDMCLKRKHREERASKRPVKKKLPNLVWNMMKDKELRASCKKHGLISSGKKPELMKRLKEYTLRYNSQIDQLKQKSGPELAREVEQAERMIQKTPPGVVGNLKTEADRAAYSNKYEDQFVKLINAARKNNGDKSVNRTQDSDEIKIVHEVQSTPKKKCAGSLREFFKSPPKSSSPLSVSSPTFSNRSKVSDSQEIREFPSSVSEICNPVEIPSSSETYSERSNHDLVILSPVQTCSPVTTGTPNFKLAAKSLFNSQNDPAPNRSSDLFAEDEDDFDDFENDENLDEMIQSFTQVPKNQDTDKSNNRSFSSSSNHEEPNLSFSPTTPTRVSPLSSRLPKNQKNNPSKKQNKNQILNEVLKTEDNVYIEQEVSRLYTFRDENTNPVNTSSVSKLDKLLERSCKRNRTPKQGREPALNDSMAELLDDLSKSPGPAVLLPNNNSSHSATDGGMVTADNMESPPRHIPDIDEDDLPAFNSQSEDDDMELNSGDEIPEISPVITTGMRLRKRTSGSISPFNETPPKRGRIL